MIFHGRIVVRGRAEGELLATLQPLSFLGGVDPESGIIRDQKHELFSQSIRGKVFALPYSVGSSVGAYVIYGMAVRKTNPVAIVSDTGDINLVTGCAAAGIPLLLGIKINNLIGFKGKKAILDGDSLSIYV